MPDRKNEPQQKQSKDELAESQSGVSAVRHVGKTLESDPEYNDRPSRELAPEIGLVDRHGNDLTASPNMHAGSDPLVGTEMSETGMRVEPLKTRLPGDSSSDPHTDVGPDNATEVQRRGE
jgi:hypothetical protein